eukprot:09966.XXX_110365_111186_1 [CDS] Oithona nana genome sequencing.
MSTNVPPYAALCSGAFAGIGVDLTLLPLDTLKTRLQSKRGLLKSGGFSRLWSGIGPVAIGSGPGAAIFFLTYEQSKSRIYLNVTDKPVYIHMMAASTAEVAACSVRVPVEVIKQRMQVASDVNTKSSQVLSDLLKTEGPRGLYRGFATTVIREVPFSMIQFPLWEWLKSKWARHLKEDRVTPLQSSVCGAISGGISAAITTPLDVAKTRIMLADASSQLARKQSTYYALKLIKQERGWIGWWAGVTPRVAWISIGGALFLGIYDLSLSFFEAV